MSVKTNSPEEALVSATDNLPEINEICAAVGLARLTAQKAVSWYYAPDGSVEHDFRLDLPDLGASYAEAMSAFSPTHKAKWKIAVIVTCGKQALDKAIKTQIGSSEA